jgi:hypothetical protein
MYGYLSVGVLLVSLEELWSTVCYVWYLQPVLTAGRR